MTDLLLQIWSVADMDLERAASVGRAFDEDAELRPLRVGGDPARIRVEPTLEDLIRRTGLPIDWLTVRTNSRRDGLELGELDLRHGRGGFTGRPDAEGTYQYVLSPHHVQAAFLRSWTDVEAGRLDRVEALFGRLCEAIDACYGIAVVLPVTRGLPAIDRGLGDVGWLNFFGPAFLERWPALADTGPGSARVHDGGVVIRTASTPWELPAWDLTAAPKRPVVDAVGATAFIEIPSQVERGVLVPSLEDHMRFSPGTTEMPWVAWLRDRDEAKTQRSRERRHATARRRRERAQQDRSDPGPVSRDAEWSTSFDADDWRSFGRRLFRRLGGELAGPIGRALLDETLNAPLHHEEALAVSTELGPIEVRWFIDDVDTVDLYLFGPAELPPLVDAAYERWGDG